MAAVISRRHPVKKACRGGVTIIELLIAANLIGLLPTFASSGETGETAREERNNEVSPETPSAEVKTFTVPPVGLGFWPEEPVSIDAPAVLKSGQEMVVEGVIHTGNPKWTDALVYVEFYRTEPDGTHVITQTCQTMVLSEKNTDGDIRYRIEMRGPISTGEQSVEVRLWHFASSKEFLTFGRSEIKVE
jgi:hypothetical protein